MASATKQTIRLLIELSRYDRYNSLLALFPSIFSTLLSGASNLRDPSHETTVLHVYSQMAWCALHCYIFSGAGMVWNDWVDKEIDARVARTKNRPLAAGRVRVSHAIAWMAVQYLVAAAILLHAVGNLSVWAFAMILETAGTTLYPFAKRPAARNWYIYPQYILGALGLPLVISGRAAIHASKNKTETEGLLATLFHSLPLSVFIFLWILYYNTAYSYQDIRDDRKMHVQSMYNLGGQRIHAFLVFLGTLVLINIAWVLGASGQQSSNWLWTAWMGVWTVVYVVQFSRFEAAKPATGGMVHKQNVFLGLWNVVVFGVEVFLAQA
ncbi:hypothetical protein N7465_000506 [Penicillium sp. CMV-2018d]|nr:hypothetical protein N7465_000506 [Penicillium sp. CMV-2018d]